MKGAGYAHMAIGHGSGKDKARDAATAVISSPLLETSISGAKRLLINIAMSEDILSADVDAATKMITDTAADGVEFIFGTAFKEDMQDEMIITVIAAGFDDTDDSLTVLDNQNSNNAETASAAPAAQEAQPETHEEEQQSTMQEEYISIDNPLIDSLGFGSSSKPSSSSQDYDLDDIFKMLGN
jgi:cell division protein FtsZ